MDVPAPFRLYEVTVAAEWTDYNHHLTESAYLLIMGESSDAFFRFFGIDDAYRDAGHSLYTVETHLRNLHEAERDGRLGAHGRYGLSSVNLDRGWVGRDMVGIDAGAAVLALDNHLNENRVRNVFHTIPCVQRGLERSGFQAPLRPPPLRAA